MSFSLDLGAGPRVVEREHAPKARRLAAGTWSRGDQRRSEAALRAQQRERGRRARFGLRSLRVYFARTLWCFELELRLGMHAHHAVLLQDSELGSRRRGQALVITLRDFVRAALNRDARRSVKVLCRFNQHDATTRPA